MEIKASYLAISGGVESMRADALLGILKERGRGFASDSETWEELRLSLTNLEKQTKNIKKVHDEMWAAVEDRNEDAFSALCQEFERAAATLSGEWARASVLAKIALENPELPEEPTKEEKIAADQERLAVVREKLADVRELLPAASGGAREALEAEERRLDNEEQEIIVRLTAAGTALKVTETEKRSTYYEYAGDMTPEEYEAFQKRVDEEREHLKSIRARRQKLAEEMRQIENKRSHKYTVLKKQDNDLRVEEADIETALEDAGVVVYDGETPDEG